MMFKFDLGAAVLLAGLTTAGIASAEEAAATEPVASAEVSNAREQPSQGHASGLMVQARVQSQSSLLSLAGGGTGFLLGYQGPSYAVGLGFGLSRVGLNSGGESASLTALQLAPTAIIDVWHSKDGRARANLIASVGYARASLDATVTSQECSGSSTGQEMCTTSSEDRSATATLIPALLGFGGDYYLSRNFALGAEFGVQALFLASANSDSGSSSKSVDVGGNAQFAYGALRATFVLGD